MTHQQKRLAVGLAGLLVIGGLALVAICQLVVEGLWFQELGYLQVFWRRLQVLVAVGIVVPSISLTFLSGNLVLAKRWSRVNRSQPSHPLPGAMGLRWLLVTSSSLALALSVLCVYYSQLAVVSWRGMTAQDDSLPTILVSATAGQLWQLVQSLSAQPWQWALVGLLSLAMVLWPYFVLSIMAILLSLGLAGIFISRWDAVALYFHPQLLHQTEPLFHQDISLYLFKLGIWEMLSFWALALTIVALLMTSLVYIVANNTLSQGKFAGFSIQQQRHLYTLGASLALAIAVSYWLSRYELLYSSRGVTYGAGYADVNVQLPVNTLMTGLAVAIALQLVWWAIRSQPQSALPQPPLRRPVTTVTTAYRQTNRQRALPRLTVRSVVIGFLVIAVSLGHWLPSITQWLIVQPNELEREQPYILRNIALTRQAFGLDRIEVRTFDPQTNLTFADLQRNTPTIRNIRLWDTRPLLETNRQLQQIRLYYKFPIANIDRYRLKLPASQGTGNVIERQQVIISARELDFNALPQAAQTWVNEHLIYTHGYGFTLSPVNTVGPGGLPDYFVKDIAGATEAESGSLSTANEGIRASIPIGYPRIYYGNLTNTYIMAPSRVQELDYPSGNTNVYNTYDGSGGVPISSLWRRWLFAIYLRDWQMVVTPNFQPNTKVLFRRNILQRVEAIAPFLRY
ncbi:MAG: UPF0182 family protein, partial [Cyanobacteria bacterium]|nr:UPF0182 family protein [Cyanobacteriota bacterium]MDW8203081.1 UPF0182 family protein [Cyanobacteriota bacterium SKYGB_h_bin112]